jgi:glycosyltransferase involved in cell wall biosynthesis
MLMPKIHIARYEPGRLGGGWTWAREFAKGIGARLSNYEDCQVYVIPSPSMVERAEVNQAKLDGKFIILRLDNIIRNSRNRNTGMSRMQDFARVADVVVYQSGFASDLLAGWVYPKQSAIIYNGCDLKIYNDHNRHESPIQRFLYSRYNRDETKNWEMARYIYEREYRVEPNSLLTIIGQFSDELREYNFDFYRGEKYQYLGVVGNPHALADIYRNTDQLIYTYFNDACSNTLIEALCCGCDLLDPYEMAGTGGSAEIVDAFNKHGAEFFSSERMVKEYLELLA